MPFFDMHNHSLFGVDDGAQTEAHMCRMIDASYADGVRSMCLTPHFHPGYFGNNREKSEEAFRILQAYAAEAYPDLELYLGNELRYSPDCISWLDDGACRTMNGSRYCLVDFSEAESENKIVGGIDRLLNAGYHPILAHAERYRNLDRKCKAIHDMRENGVIIQVDAQSVLGGFGLRIQMRTKRILQLGLADLIGSDAHDTSHRPPELSLSFQKISAKYGTDYAESMFCHNAGKLIQK
ncbi:MAG: hypothetical protein Q4B22_05680 [Eubacteriales bacterium]|nr:hypothetical protein [Eubacteriales bacterium]